MDRPGLTRETALEQHRALRALLADIEALFVFTQSLRFAVTLSSRLADLEVAVEEHFAQEEEGGLFAHLAEAAPEARPEVEALLAQHRRLRARAARLCQQARRGLTPSAALGTAVRRFIRDLERHEGRENELIVRVLDAATAAQD